MDPSFTFSDSTVGFLLDGKLDRTTMQAMQETIRLRLNNFGKINLYIEDNDIDSFTIPAVIEDIIFKVSNSDQFLKVALVTDRKWIQACGAIENWFLSSSIKTFDVSERLKAISWIAE